MLNVIRNEAFPIHVRVYIFHAQNPLALMSRRALSYQIEASTTFVAPHSSGKVKLRLYAYLLVCNAHRAMNN